MIFAKGKVIAFTAMEKKCALTAKVAVRHDTER